MLFYHDLECFISHLVSIQLWWIDNQILVSLAFDDSPPNRSKRIGLLLQGRSRSECWLLSMTWSSAYSLRIDRSQSGGGFGVMEGAVAGCRVTIEIDIVELIVDEDDEKEGFSLLRFAIVMDE
jgi:hypothetical protein